MKTRAPSAAPSKAASPSGAKESSPAPRPPAPASGGPAGPTVERAARLGLRPSRLALGPARPVQRLVGFEAELSVPTMGPPPAQVDERFVNGPGDVAPDVAIDQFLNHGLPYSRDDLGFHPKFRLSADHNILLTDGDTLKEELRAGGHLQGRFGQPLSNLEYATEPVDELAPLSDQRLERQIDAVAEHAAWVVKDAKREVEEVPDTVGLYAGVPEREFEEWLGEAPAALETLQSHIHDDLYLQITAGILPSAIPSLYAAAAQNDGPLRNPIFAAVVNDGIGRLWQHREFRESWDFQMMSAIQQEELKGVLTLAYSYMVGDAVCHTTMLPDGVDTKSAVLFLSQMNLGDLKLAAPTLNLGEINGPSAEFATTITNFLILRPHVDPDWWVRSFRNVQARPDRPDLLLVPITKVVQNIFNGDEVPTASPHSLAGDLQQPAVQEASERQRGVPLEYRTIRERPKPGGLKALVQQFVDQIRELNTRHLEPEDRERLIREAKGEE